MKILLLGGIGEARQLAEQLHARGHDVIYSVAGLTTLPAMSCALHRGGFGGVKGLLRFLAESHIEQILDVTHPYAVQMTQHAAQASRNSGVLVWHYLRPAWRPAAGDDWRTFTDLGTLIRSDLRSFSRPFFAMGRQPLAHLSSIAAHQRCVLRAIDSATTNNVASERVRFVDGKGPFALESERALLADQQIDVLVCKNSGGHAAKAKLDAARAMGLPVYMQARPPLNADAALVFSDVNDILHRLDFPDTGL